MGARQYIEKMISARCVQELIANGYYVSVHNGSDDEPSKPSADAKAVVALLHLTDEDVLLVHNKSGAARYHGWVKLIYGNDDGSTVIGDYTTNLEGGLRKTLALIEEIENA